jgi:hypothetical protein
VPTKFVTNPRRPAAKNPRRAPMRRNYAGAATTNYLRGLRPGQVERLVREGSLDITHSDIGNDYYTVTLFEQGQGENYRQVEAKWFVKGDDAWYDLSLGLRNGKVDPATADLFLGPSRWDKREREEQTRAAAKRKGITIDASRHYFNNPRPSNGPSAAQLRAVGRYVKMVDPEQVAFARRAGKGTSDTALGKYAYDIYGDDPERWEELCAAAGGRDNPRRPAAKRNPSSKRKVHRAGQYAVIEEHDGRLFFGRYERDGEFVISPADKSRVLATEAGRKKAIATYFARVGAKANPRRKNPPKGFRIAGPAVKTLVDGLRISKADAQRLKDMMDTGAPRILQAADKMMDGNGVERISGVGGGLMYVNMGDTYDTTLIYDYKTNRFVVSSWGDIVERQPRRFGD